MKVLRYDKNGDAVWLEKKEVRGDRGQKYSNRWPQHLEALACDPSQIGLQKKMDKSLGIRDTEYDRHGCPILRDPGHRREYVKAHGYYDRNAGYCDVSPSNR